MDRPLAAALDRLFADSLLANKNSTGAYWTGTDLHAEHLAKAMGAWSRGEHTLARIALDLVGYQADAYQPLALANLFDRLDETRVRTFLEALATFALVRSWTVTASESAVQVLGGRPLRGAARRVRRTGSLKIGFTYVQTRNQD